MHTRLLVGALTLLVVSSKSQSEEIIIKYPWLTAPDIKQPVIEMPVVPKSFGKLVSTSGGPTQKHDVLGNLITGEYLLTFENPGYITLVSYQAVFGKMADGTDRERGQVHQVLRLPKEP